MMTDQFSFSQTKTGLLEASNSHCITAKLFLVILACSIYFQPSVAQMRPITLQGAEQELDMGSDTAWSICLDGGVKRPVIVPGGGWNSDLQNPQILTMKDVQDHVVYERMIQIPATLRDKIIKIQFGAVNYGAEVFIDNQKVGEHEGSISAFEFDITSFIRWGEYQKLKVKAYHRRHYMTRPGNNGPTCLLPAGWEWPGGSDSITWREAKSWYVWAGESKFGYGITKYVKLLVLPSVYISDLQVITSVRRQEFICALEITNFSGKDQSIRLEGHFSSWGNQNFIYPAVKSLGIKIPDGKTVKAIIKVPWLLGHESYWWPNIPFREDYRACLHYLNLALSGKRGLIQSFSQRFGFVEHAEGQYYYTVNGVRVTGMSDGTAEPQMSGYDVYSLCPAFLHPTKPGTGCPETWKKYMRIGFNTNRLHCSTPTRYMMEAADEVGFMLIPEAPVWGNGTHFFNERTTLANREIVRFCRNHPSVARYSLTNEVGERPDLTFPWRACIDAAWETDSTRPLVFEIGAPTGRIDGYKHGHAYFMEHYRDFNKDVTGEIRGMGEHFWSTDGMVPFAIGAMTLRVNNWSYFAPWSWINYWPNFLEGMSHDKHAWKVNRYPDREDNKNGWGSPVVKFVQKALNPFLVVDEEILKNNPAPKVWHGTEEWKGKQVIQPDSANVAWPVNLPSVMPGEEVTRVLRVFNNDLENEDIELRWEARWDSPEGNIAINTERMSLTIQPGFNALCPIHFRVPLPGSRQRRLYLILETYKNNKMKFREGALYFNIVNENI